MIDCHIAAASASDRPVATRKGSPWTGSLSTCRPAKGSMFGWAVSRSR